MEVQNKTKQPRIAVVHDHLGFQGGGERTALVMALAFNADFITAYAHPEAFCEYQKNLGPKLKVLAEKVINTRGVRFFWLRALFFKNRKIFKDYDILIASGQTATEAVSRYAPRKSTKIVYTHTTPRRVFDQYESSIRMYKPILRPFYAIFARLWKKLYLSSIRKFDINIANSQCVRNRVKQHTGGDVSAVVWPPIWIDNFKWKGQEDYYLSYGRIDEAKRVELIVKAFKDLPRHKLIVASGGPRLEMVRELAKGCPNIEVLGWVSDEKLYDLVGKCRAVIYIPINEDAGMTHLEANSAGKPFLGVKEGGLIESTIEGETGILLDPDPAEEAIRNKVVSMDAGWCASKRNICEAHAKNYDQKVFIEKIGGVLAKNNPFIPVIGIDASRWEDPRFPGEERRTGVEAYAFGLISELAGLIISAGLRPRIYTPRTLWQFPLDYQKVIPGNRQWTAKLLANELKYSLVDFFITPAYYIPEHAPEKSFAIIHDVIFKTSPENYPIKERLSQEYAIRKNLERAKRIITISENSKNDLIREYGLSAENLSVVPMGYTRDKPVDYGKKREQLILYIGRVEKKKSVDILIKAFKEFKLNHPAYRLYLAGKPGYGYDGIVSLIEQLGLKDDIEILGYVGEKEKWDLLSRTEIFVHPSANEGSCIPLLEAWDAHTPALVADIPVMKEMAAAGALFFNKSDYRNLAEKLAMLSDDQALRSRLVDAGEENLSGHSWKKTAEKILDIMLEKTL